MGVSPNTHWILKFLVWAPQLLQFFPSDVAQNSPECRSFSVSWFGICGFFHADLKWQHTYKVGTQWSYKPHKWPENTWVFLGLYKPQKTGVVTDLKLVIQAVTFLSPNVGGHLTQGFTCSPSPKKSQNRGIPWVPRRFPTSFAWMERVMSNHFCPRVGPSIQLETDLSYIPLDPNNPWKNEGFDPWNYGKL